MSSCKREDSNSLQPAAIEEKVTDYFPLAVGDYWIYEIYTADTSLVFPDLVGSRVFQRKSRTRIPLQRLAFLLFFPQIEA